MIDFVWMALLPVSLTIKTPQAHGEFFSATLNETTYICELLSSRNVSGIFWLMYIF